MKIPTMRGLIDRRILLNFTANPREVARIIPAPFRPATYQGKAIVGICLIRLKHIRPKGLPGFIGVASENGAHRIAVEWDENGRVKTGVFIPRRDTSLRINALVGGRLFPGKHHLATFNVRESAAAYHVDFRSSDETVISVDATECERFDESSIFKTLENASAFFEKGDVGYSPNGNKFDGLKLATATWQVRPLAVQAVTSSFFENEALFSQGSVKFDNALLMTRVAHEWHSLTTKRGAY